MAALVTLGLLLPDGIARLIGRIVEGFPA